MMPKAPQRGCGARCARLFVDAVFRLGAAPVVLRVLKTKRSRGSACDPIPKDERPRPRHSDRRGVCLEDTADESRIGEHVEVIVVPLAG
jgi:hypothetical protein